MCYENAILSVEEMYKADAAAIKSGVSGEKLMEAAGHAVAMEIRKIWNISVPIAVLCGPGNNGGDGFVAARYLKMWGYNVKLALLGKPESLKGDAAINKDRWSGKIHKLCPEFLHGFENAGGIVVDAVFGAGLARAIEGKAADTINYINDNNILCVGVDVPSGVDGNTGQVLGTAPVCVFSVTFFRPKPAHYLLPARDIAGSLFIADIGIPSEVLNVIKPSITDNDVNIDSLPLTESYNHKYERGHALIYGGMPMTGAARLAARAARRTGAGLVTVACSEKAFNIYALDSAGNIVVPVESMEDFKELLSDERINVVLSGPGNGVGDETAKRTKLSLEAGKTCVVDADAITSFIGRQDEFFSLIDNNCIMTPHEGEFSRLFDFKGNKIERALKAAEKSGAVIVLKGSDTVIASPDGRVAINDNAPSYLATAGSGDVLAGIITGLFAQGMKPFEAACAGVWMHGKTGEIAGCGLIAEDLPDIIPDIFAEKV